MMKIYSVVLCAFSLLITNVYALEKLDHTDSVSGCETTLLNFKDLFHMIAHIRDTLKIDLFMYQQGGYIFVFSDDFYGDRLGGMLKEPQLKEYDPKNENRDYVIHLLNLYKIHLMPATIQQLYKIITKIISRAQNDKQFAKSVYAVKIKANILALYQQSCHMSVAEQKAFLKEKLSARGETFPIIVLYPARTKGAAEYCLKILCGCLGDLEGLNITPRYNKKINSLVYYAQGNGDEKIDTNKKYFTDDRVHYRVAQFNKEQGLAFDQSDMKLKIPASCDS